MEEVRELRARVVTPARESNEATGNESSELFARSTGEEEYEGSDVGYQMMVFLT